MNIEKLGKQIRKEFLRSPKKTAALGLMCLVALYFWAPLLGNWFAGGSGSAASEETAHEEVASPQLPLPQTAGSASSPSPQFHWTEFRTWIEGDADMTPAGDELLLRDPFAGAQLATMAAVDTDDLESQQTVESQTPQQAGLELGGTMVGAGNRVAIIDGRPYREGELITTEEAGEFGATSAVETGFRVERIERDRVILTRNSMDYTLALPQYGNVTDLVIRRTTQRDTD